jgi:hypothetical protein
MPHLQPTVRQLQPLGRRDDSAAIVHEQVEPNARAANTSSADLTTSPRQRRRWRRWLTARPRPTT